MKKGNDMELIRLRRSCPSCNEPILRHGECGDVCKGVVDVNQWWGSAAGDKGAGVVGWQRMVVETKIG